jgi:hypothetical protein
MDGGGLVAEGDIYPCRFIKPGTSAWGALQATLNSANVGISIDAQKAPATTSGGVAATTGDTLNYFEEGEYCLLEFGGTVGIDGEVTSDANGKGIAVGTTSGTTYYVSAIAIEGGAAGSIRKVKIVRYTKYAP